MAIIRRKLQNEVTSLRCKIQQRNSFLALHNVLDVEGLVISRYHDDVITFLKSIMTTRDNTLVISENRTDQSVRTDSQIL